MKSILGGWEGSFCCVSLFLVLVCVIFIFFFFSTFYFCLFDLFYRNIVFFAKLYRGRDVLRWSLFGKNRRYFLDSVILQHFPRKISSKYSQIALKDFVIEGKKLYNNYTR